MEVQCTDEGAHQRVGMPLHAVTKRIAGATAAAVGSKGGQAKRSRRAQGPPAAAATFSRS